jgi:hypothetical protein
MILPARFSFLNRLTDDVARETAWQVGKLGRAIALPCLSHSDGFDTFTGCVGNHTADVHNF